MANIINKKTAWIKFTIQAAFLRGILHLLNHPPSDLKLFTKGLPPTGVTTHSHLFQVNVPCHHILELDIG